MQDGVVDYARTVATLQVKLDEAIDGKSLLVGEQVK